MPSLQATTTVEQVVSLSAKARVELRKQLKAWADLQAQMAPLKAKAKAIEAQLEATREAAGVKTLQFEGFKVTRVGGNSKTFNKEDFVFRGGDLALYNDCIESTPKAEHTRITAPGAKEYGDEG